MNNDPELAAALSLFSYLGDSKKALASAEETLEWCRRNGARVLFPGHKDYPFGDDCRLEDRPAFLACWGESPWQHGRCISVVGSREPSDEALLWMETHFSRFLRERSAVVVSGGARGVDQKAHFLAIRSGRPTVVFLPSGLARLYPAEWSEWKEWVFETGGALLSQYPPHLEIRRRHFESRNRLIAALGKFLFVVEARRRSGSTMTARLAVELDRTVSVLPANPSDPRAGGTIDLLFDGAQPLRDHADLVSIFDLEGGCIRADSGLKSE